MKLRSLYLYGLSLLGLISPQAIAAGVVHHALEVMLMPDQQRLEVRDTLTLPPSSSRTLNFYLNAALRPVMASGAKLTVGKTAADDTFYQLELPAGQQQVTLNYQGKIAYPLQQQAGELRQSQETLGTITPQGVYLDSASSWVARFDDELVTFTLDVHMPSGWSAVSGGERVAASPLRWQERQPQNDIYLVAAPFKEYSQMQGNIELQVFLRSADNDMAQRYLQATGAYLAMYEKLLGAYPYKKFALVENFWETGYGMPSFTLLGSQVIRLPFILYSSYPHELLHNWWGNSVYVDYSNGNWSEGLTSYLSDHLLQEQRGEGAVYRQALLQKFSDFVNKENDFPLEQFKARVSPASEAIGYGKTMLLLHSLRLQIGDKLFSETLRSFYKDHRFQRVNFLALRDAFIKITGRDFSPEFQQALTRAGAPMLQLNSAKARPAGGGYLLEIEIEQTQAGEPFSLNLPIAITSRDKKMAYQATLPLTAKKATFRFPLENVPLRVDIDPEFDLFRRLDSSEIAPAFSRAFGDEKALMILPADAPKATLKAYQALALEWLSEQQIVLDKDLKGELPPGRSVWIVGWENRFFDTPAKMLGPVANLSRQAGLQFGAQAFTRSSSAFAVSAKHPSDPLSTVHWLAADSAAAIGAVARKLPHYAKYSYVVFQASDMTSIAKGLWPVTESPLTRTVVQTDGTMIAAPRAALASRRPLAELDAPIAAAKASH